MANIEVVTPDEMHAEMEKLRAEMKELMGSIPPPLPDEPDGIIVSSGDNLQQAIDDAGSTPIYIKGTHVGAFKLRQGTQLLAHPGADHLLTGATTIPAEYWEKSGDAYFIDWKVPLYQHPANQVRSGAAGLAHRRAMQPHMLIVDGVPLLTVHEPKELTAGRIFLEGTAQNPVRLWVRFPNDQPPSDFSVHAAVHQRILYCETGDVDGVHLEGLVMRYCANTGYQGMLDFPEMADGWTLKDIDLQWSNTEGIRIKGTGHVIENLITDNHGQSGISTEKMLRCLLDGIRTSYNNWKGFDQKWDAGNKFRNSKENTIRNLFAADNPIWFDIWNQDNALQNFEIINAPCWGLHVEHHSSNNTFVDGRIAGTRIYQGIADTGSNLHIQGSITGCVFSGIELAAGEAGAIHYKKKEIRGGVPNYSGHNTFDNVLTGGQRCVIEGDPDHMPDTFERMEKPGFVVWPR